MPASACRHWLRSKPTDRPRAFSIGFQVAQEGYAKTLGMLLKGNGQFVYDEETRQLSSGRMVIAADSVFTNHKKRDGHLRDRHFLQANRLAERDQLRMGV